MLLTTDNSETGYVLELDIYYPEQVEKVSPKFLFSPGKKTISEKFETLKNTKI